MRQLTRQQQGKLISIINMTHDRVITEQGSYLMLINLIDEIESFNTIDITQCSTQ